MYDLTGIKKQEKQAKQNTLQRENIAFTMGLLDHMWPLDVPVERKAVISKSFGGITRAKSSHSLPPLTKSNLRRT